MTLTHDDVDEILHLLDGTEAELLVEDGDFRLEVRRTQSSGRETRAPAAARPSRPAPAAASGAAADAAPGPAPDATPDATPGATPGAASDSLEIAAPMAGTFYRAASPGDPPFVEEGGRVEAGAPLCLIEVMKLFTTVEAPRAGRVARILAENAQAVGAGQPLFAILPD